MSRSPPLTRPKIRHPHSRRDIRSTEIFIIRQAVFYRFRAVFPDLPLILAVGVRNTHPTAPERYKSRGEIGGEISWEITLVQGLQTNNAVARAKEVGARTHWDDSRLGQCGSAPGQAITTCSQSAGLGEQLSGAPPAGIRHSFRPNTKGLTSRIK